MRLSRFEKFRNKRQHNFEVRLLTQTTLKPTSRFIRIINAPFTIWLMSALVLGFGSLYYATYKQCVIDATKLGQDYSLYRAELVHRQVSLGLALYKAKTSADILKLQSRIPADVVELKDKRLSQIVAAVRGYSIQIKFALALENLKS
jgi:hypothetical protein